MVCDLPLAAALDLEKMFCPVHSSSLIWGKRLTPIPTSGGCCANECGNPCKVLQQRLGHGKYLSTTSYNKNIIIITGSPGGEPGLDTERPCSRSCVL